MSLTALIQAPEHAGEEIRRLLAALSDKRQLNMEAATALADGIKDHFRENNTSHRSAEALGASESGFWGRMVRGTVPSADENNGYVTMPREVALRFFGGTLRPTGGKKYLAIPATASAYGKRAADFSDLKFGLARNRFGVMQPALVRDDAQKGVKGKHTALGKERTHGLVYFFLARQAVQKPDPDVLPSSDVAQAYVDHGITEYLTRQGGLS